MLLIPRICKRSIPQISLTSFRASTTATATSAENSNSLGSRRKERLKQRADRYQAKFVPDTNRPKLQSLLRTLYMRSHPDIIRHSEPGYADINSESMQLLNGVLSTLKEPNQYPPRISQVIPFYCKSNETIVLHELKLIGSGGDSKRQLTDTFSQFFKEIGILDTKDFTWDKEYFPEGEATNSKAPKT
jgi:hypothetical protein